MTTATKRVTTHARVVPTRLSSGRVIMAGCAWADKGQTVCTSPDCLTRADKDGIKLLEECRRTA